MASENTAENTSASAECWSCPSLSGERRISPGPFIHVGRYWIVDHAYPTQLPGWLVLVLKRHAEALHELTGEEMVEMGDLIRRASLVLREVIGCEKEYVSCYAEAAHFAHIHVHVIPRAADLPGDLRGPRVFGLLAADDVVPPDEIRALSEALRARFPS
jgi:diadenosine tetraphosphate (Ap4A) HIT family hydrolase